jgi:hypothetical protein
MIKVQLKGKQTCAKQIGKIIESKSLQLNPTILLSSN